MKQPPIALSLGKHVLDFRAGYLVIYNNRDLSIEVMSRDYSRPLRAEDIDALIAWLKEVKECLSENHD